MRYLSTWEAGVDDKRRVTVPAEFRAALKAASPGQDGEHLRVWMADGGWLEASDDVFARKLGREVARAAAGDADMIGDLYLEVFGASRKLVTDSAGRIVLPEAFAEHAGVTNKAVFQGVGPLFRILSPARAEALVAAARARTAELKARAFAAAMAASWEDEA